MSHLTTAEGHKEALLAIKGRRDRRHAAYTAARWGSDGQRVPSSHVDLREESVDTKRAVLQDLMTRARAEVEGRAPGDMAQTVVNTPSMTRVLAEEAQDGA